MIGWTELKFLYNRPGFESCLVAVWLCLFRQAILFLRASVPTYNHFLVGLWGLLELEECLAQAGKSPTFGADRL